MQTIKFLNEHLMVGNLGHFAVIISVFGALFAAICYTRAVRHPMQGWLKLARIGFIIQALAVLTIFITLFTIIHSHYYEYQYAWQHSSNTLPTQYMISCFWEGQEGSFLLWMFWHAVLGCILLVKAKSWEAPVMAIVSLAQVVLGSMLIGIDIYIPAWHEIIPNDLSSIHILGNLHLNTYHLGSSPFQLLREHQPDFLRIPVIEMLGGPAHYLKAVKDGNGLNPLLQNYWMVIHPPTLFFGFACVIVPFAYAFAGLWTKKYKEWITPALPWTLIAVMVLGTGIIMGGYWAYESLNFGG
ncbi:MAG: cytochrome c biogenesis protein CcsA, partial [Bacteroidia bacterium]|nr:cytochrome c biogenesis protein CcsA [Bacteroidia bacterium]